MSASSAVHGTLAGENPTQPQPISYRVALPVVVEVAVDVTAPREPPHALGPLAELGLRVVPAAPPRPLMEADERPVRRQLVRLERPLRMVADHERDAVRAQERVDVPGEPALVPELEAVPLAVRQLLERVGEPLVVALERARQLPEDRAAAPVAE